MISQRAELPIVAFSVRVYQALLLAYPTKFQQEYGSQMLQVFQDCCLRALRHGGTNGMVRLWLVTLFDLIQSVISEHAQKEVQMKKEMKPEDIQRAGVALIAGAVAFFLSLLIGATQVSNWYVMIILITFISQPLLAFGLLGLRNRYGGQVGGFGKNMLLIGAILGPIISLIGLIGEGVDPYWILIFIGSGVLFACLVLFGIVSLYKKPLPRWNVLPILGGLWFPFRFFTAMVTSLTTGDSATGDYLSIADFAFLTIQCVALVALGYILRSDVPQETAAPA